MYIYVSIKKFRGAFLNTTKISIIKKKSTGSTLMSNLH